MSGHRELDPENSEIQPLDPSLEPRYPTPATCATCTPVIETTAKTMPNQRAFPSRSPGRHRFFPITIPNGHKSQMGRA